MTKAHPPPRLVFAALVLLCGCLLGFGYYLQFQEGLEPCPMCIFQRLCYILLLGTGAVAFIHSPAEAGLRCYVALIGVFALLGAGIAGPGSSTCLKTAYQPVDQDSTSCWRCTRSRT
jgi:disulfide bond formation protein DsbB